MQWTQGHRALRHPEFNGSEDFCLVHLKADPPNKYVSQCARYRQVLESGITICNHRYLFFGLSNSQLREFSYWFIRANSLDEIDHKRRLLGDFDAIHNIGKYVARLGLWFSKSDPTGVRSFLSKIDSFLLFLVFIQIQLKYIEDPEDFHQEVEQGKYCVTKMEDIQRNEYCFTDGNGLISKGLARLIAEKVGYLVESEGNVCLSSFCFSRTKLSKVNVF